MYRIKTMNKISPKGLAKLDATLFAVSDDYTDEQAILVRSAKLHDYDFPTDLLAIARAGAGVNNIPLDRCAEAGIVVFNTPGANANAVKELALCALLLASRNITGGVEWVKEQCKNGVDVAPAVEKGKAAFAGVEIMGKTLGVVGLGAIGILVANAAVALGMDVVGYDPFLSVNNALTLSPAVRVVDSLAKVYGESDYLSLHLPMTADTKESINAAAFAQMKQGVRIINLARGELVHNGDIAAALEGGAVASYVTDFPDSQITCVPGVVPIPHLGASSEESEENCAMMAAEEISDYLLRGNIRNSVNLPNLTMDWGTDARVAVLYQADEAMGNKVTAALGNVQAFATATRGAYGYLLADVSSADDKAVAALSSLEGVLRVRLLKK